MKKDKYLKNMYCLNHPNQKVNLICINKKCKDNGLICHLCKSQNNQYHHQYTHNHQKDIIPLKIFIETLENNIYQNKSQQKQGNEYKYIKMIEDYRDEMFFNLKVLVQQMSRYIQIMQLRILNEFQTKKSIILNKHILFNQYKKIIQKTIIHDVKKQQKFQIIKGIKNIVANLTISNEQDYNNDKFYLDLSGKMASSQFYQQKEQFKTLCSEFQSKTANFMKAYKDKIFVMETQGTKIENQQIKQKKKKIKISQINTMKISKKQDDYSIQQQIQDKIMQNTSKESSQNILNAIKKQKKKNKLLKKQLLFHNQQQFLDKQQKIEQLIQKLHQNIKQQQKNDISDNNKSKTIFLDKIKQGKKVEKIKDKNQVQFQEQTIKPKYHLPFFSNYCKGSSIKLNKNNKIASHQISTVPNQGFAVIAESIKKRNKLALRIKSIEGQIYVGMCICKIIFQNKFQLKKNIVNHGAYMISNKGNCYSNNNDVKNINFTYEEGDIINLTYLNKTLFLECAAKKPQKSHLKIYKLEQNVNFCIYFGEVGGSIEIL